MATIAETLRIYVAENHRNWKLWIDDVEKKINWTQHTVTKKEPALLVGKKRDYDRFAAHCGYKIEKPVPTETHVAEARRNQQIYIQRRKALWKHRNFDEIKLKIGDQVYVKRFVLSEKGTRVSKKLTELYKGPYIVHAPFRRNSYLLLDPETDRLLGKPQNIRNLKYHYQQPPSCLK